MYFTAYQNLLLQPITSPKWFKISRVFSWRMQKRKGLFLINPGLQKYTSCGPCQKFTEVEIIDSNELIWSLYLSSLLTYEDVGAHIIVQLIAETIKENVVYTLSFLLVHL